MMSSTILWHNQAFLQFLCYWGFSTSEVLYQKSPNKIRQRQRHSSSRPWIFLGGIYFQKHCCYLVVEISCCLWPASLSVQTFPATIFQFGCYATSPGRHFYCVCAFPCIDDPFNVFLFSHNLNLMLLMFSAVSLNLSLTNHYRTQLWYFTSYLIDSPGNVFLWTFLLVCFLSCSSLSWFSLSTSQDTSTFHTIIVA